MPVPSLPKTATVLLLAAMFVPTPLLHAGKQDAKEAKKPEQPKIPEISDTPRTVDPAKFVHEKLAAAVTVKFEEASLREVGEWIQKQQKIPVVFDKEALAKQRIPLGEPVSDRLDKEPLYLLLNRLRMLGVAWYVRDDVLHLTTVAVADERMATDPINLGNLLDAGFEAETLRETIQSAVPGPWFAVDGVGGELKWLGDVLFVRQTDAQLREVRGLLAALKEHGRQTFTLDPPQHEALRTNLAKNVSVRFQETPLAVALQQLAEQSETDIRLDVPVLRKQGVHERQPVSLTLADRDLRTVLRILLADFNLTFTLRDGVLLVTDHDRAESPLKSAVYDVRDLCRDDDEAAALQAAIQSQTDGPWFEVDGIGGVVVFARPGVLVVRHTERSLNQVGDLLTKYRSALRVSKRRDRGAERSREVVTRYYRMHDATAADLVTLLPRLVSPESWNSEANAEAPGTILKLASPPSLLGRGDGGKDKPGAQTAIVSNAVLIVRQRRDVHDEIAEVVRRVEQGDDAAGFGGAGEPGGIPAGMGGMGGFGGGYFSVPEQ